MGYHKSLSLARYPVKPFAGLWCLRRQWGTGSGLVSGKLSPDKTEALLVGKTTLCLLWAGRHFP